MNEEQIEALKKACIEFHEALLFYGNPENYKARVTAQAIREVSRGMVGKPVTSEHYLQVDLAIGGEVLSDQGKRAREVTEKWVEP